MKSLVINPVRASGIPWRLCLMVVATLLITSPVSRATIVVSATNDIDIADDWRTTDYPHTADIDNDNVYGMGFGSNWVTGVTVNNTNSGYVMFNVGQTVSTNTIASFNGNILSNAAVYLPIYVAAVTNHGSSLLYGGLTPIDKAPLFGPEDVPSITSGGIVATNGPGLQSLFDIILATNNLPGMFRLGVMIDNLPAGDLETPTNLTVTTDEGSATWSTVSSNGINDFYFFDLYNLTPGDTVTVWAAGWSQNNVEIGGITFETIPEPSVLAFWAAGGCVLWYRRRKSRAPKA